MALKWQQMVCVCTPSLLLADCELLVPSFTVCVMVWVLGVNGLVSPCQPLIGCWGERYFFTFRNEAVPLLILCELQHSTYRYVFILFCFIGVFI